METLTALGYRILGGTHFWIPRLLSSIWWLVGAIFLYLIARRLAGPDPEAAVVSTAFYLFLPFGVAASRSFQPESLMIASLLASLYLIVRYYQQPSTLHLLAAAIVSAFAIFVKGITLFPILGAFLVAGVSDCESRRVIFRKETLLFGIALLPTISFYLYAIFVSHSLRSVARGNILPQLLAEPRFWRGWVAEIGTVVGYTPVAAALVGTLLFRIGIPRGVVLGLWGGYGLFGMVFTYTVHTHDYWNVMIVPIVALAIGPPVALVIRAVRRRNVLWVWRAALAAIVFGALLFLAAAARPSPLPRSLEDKVAVAHRIGTLVNHSTRTIFLSPDYGLPLEYHGDLSGVPWPIASDLEWEGLAGVRRLSIQERLKKLVQKDPADYFIILSYEEYDKQRDLKAFLERRFPVVARSEDYLIFRLEGSAAQGGPGPMTARAKGDEKSERRGPGQEGTAP